MDDSKKSRSVSTAIDLAQVTIDDPGQFDDARPRSPTLKYFWICH